MVYGGEIAEAHRGLGYNEEKFKESNCCPQYINAPPPFGSEASHATQSRMSHVSYLIKSNHYRLDEPSWEEAKTDLMQINWASQFDSDLVKPTEIGHDQIG